MFLKELYSYQIQFHQPLSTNQIMKLHKLISKNTHQLYLHQGHLIADAGHLPKLLSFFLFMNLDRPIILIIDGENVEAAFQELEQCWMNRVEKSICRKRYTESMMNDNTSIVV
ncbi:hypothetical protein LCM20_02660 [Halobacillus litoralis]|uniref:hypothetical protein n=1 Tax=Halobacillus litoralis TaxID=45668 RepID=UPI001CD5B0D4|nr:hypothetical protein [Halobacillus litoralis]MCA0969492.1 hypothetical protein [Halobacillus litoralis]